MEIEVMKQDSVLQGPVAKRENFRAISVLSAIVVVLAAIAPVIGLLFPAVYRSHAGGNGMSLGKGLVMLVLPVTLALAIIFSARGSVRARLVWLGALFYIFNSYAFYVFGMPVTKLYLPVVAAFALSGLALALGIFNLDTESTKPAMIAQRPVAKGESFWAAYVLSAIVAVLAAGAAATGLLFPTVYRGNWGDGMSRGNDLVTLVVAVPVLAMGIIYSARGSVRARLLWLGALYYMFYNYAFYVFGLPVTELYLPIIATFALSGLALVFAMFNLDAEAISRRFSPRTPAKPIAGYMFNTAAMVCFLWISQWVKFLVTGRVPEVNGSQTAYQVIAAVDLGLWVVLLIPAAYCLWRHRPWGYVLGVVMNVQGAMYTAVMGVVCVFGWKLTPGSRLFSEWFIICIVGCAVSLLCLAALLLNVRREPAHGLP